MASLSKSSYDAGMKRRGKSTDASEAGSVMQLANAIMGEDREILRALPDGQMEVAREVMSRRKRALRKLAE